MTNEKEKEGKLPFWFYESIGAAVVFFAISFITPTNYEVITFKTVLFSLALSIPAGFGYVFLKDWMIKKWGTPNKK